MCKNETKRNLTWHRASHPVPVHGRLDKTCKFEGRTHVSSKRRPWRVDIVGDFVSGRVSEKEENYIHYSSGRRNIDKGNFFPLVVKITRERAQWHSGEAVDPCFVEKVAQKTTYFRKEAGSLATTRKAPALIDVPTGNV